MKELSQEELEKLAVEARREYLREWRKKNKEKVAEYQKRYWARKALREMEEEGHK